MYTLNKSSSMRNIKKNSTNKRIYHGIPQNKSVEEV
jgi:hypothetical protein